MDNNPHQMQGPLADNNNNAFMGSGVAPAGGGPLSFQFQDGQVSISSIHVSRRYHCGGWRPGETD